MQNGLRICAYCLRDLESTVVHAHRATGSSKLAKCLPFANLIEPVEPAPCRYYKEGCGELYCSARCRDSAWEHHHAVLCHGFMNEAQRAAYDRLFEVEWEQDGVDYSDTVTLTLRIVTQVIARHRLGQLNMTDAFSPFAQLIKLPLEKFHFAYLLVEKVIDTREEMLAFYKQTKEDPSQLPGVKKARTPDRTKTQLVTLFAELLHGMLAMTEEERTFFTPSRVSEVMGAVLLNSQDRSPPCSYEQLETALSNVPGGEAMLAEWTALVTQVAGKETLDQLETGTRGQGIYAAGCLFNHSCDPNLQVSYSYTNDETLHVTALRDINKGEELCISYIEETMPYLTRQQHLYEHYFFECGCPTCVEEAEEEES
ncbi:SET and MYND domain-containing protein [Angomonas deanei]|nr:SET and MYND domain-containing protein [Angomonas deanei]|eukprot:EPY27538.1 SET and MYND domain-containing protein [Angomonas deanei]